MAGPWEDFAPSQPQQASAKMPWEDFAAADAAPKIDFNRPVEAVRADIAKLPEEHRQKALQDWARAFVAKEREGVDKTSALGDLSPTRVNDVVRNFAKGTLVGTWADELNALTSDAAHSISGGKIGAPYDAAVAYQRALDEAITKERPVESAAVQIAGGLAGPGTIAKGVMKGATTLPGKMARGAAVGGTAGYVGGLGEGQGDLAQRHEYATSGDNGLLGLSPVETGVAFGAALPAVVAAGGGAARIIHDAASPSLARLGAYAEQIRHKYGIHASADGGLPESPGANAAAQQMIANQLARAGVSADDIRQSLGQAAYARQMGSNSRAQDALALVDLDPSLQRLAGSAGRADPEAFNRIQAFHTARQTGVTPRNGLPMDAGLPHRDLLAPEMTGKQVQDRFGQTFGAAKTDIVPMGQGERILDAFKRSLQIKDADSHGHAANAYRTDKAIIEAARAEAKPAYGKLYADAENINIAPHVEQVLQKWSPDGELLARESEPVKQIVKKMVDLFAPGGKPITNLEKFDRTKQYADGVIEKYFESMEGKNRYVGGLLNNLKNDLLASVDSIQTKGVGEQYKQARSMFSSRMEAREALEAGRNAFKEGSDIGVDAYRALANNPGNQKLFRLGLYGGAEDAVNRMKRADDKTRIFDNPRIQKLLQEVIPKSQGKADVFADRPQRFGAYLGDEKRMIETRNVAQGGSPTQRNKVDDEAFNAMSRLGETIERFKSSASVTMLGVRAMEQVLQKYFGMRADTAAAIAKQLYTADPLRRMEVLRGVEQRLGRNKAEQLARLMTQYESHVSQALVRQGARPGETSNGQQ